MKTERRLFTSLTRSYILFGVSIFVLNAVLGFFISDSLDIGKVRELTAGELIRPDYRDIPYDKVEAAGGTVKVLDKNWRVIGGNGTSGALNEPESLSVEEMNRLLEDNSNSSYLNSLASSSAGSANPYYLFVSVPKEGNYVLITCNAALLLLFLLNVLLFSLWTSKRFTRPLRHIVEGIQKMRDGHYSERLSYQADYEFKQIQDHFNSMASALERAEREKKETELAKERMLLDLSHDLKTPITTIQGYAKALQLGMADSPEKQQEYLDIILKKSHTVTSLIEDIFQLATLESPDYPFVAEPGDAAELLRHIAIEYYDVFRHEQFEMDIHIPDRHIILPMNRKLLHRAISNLLSNALQHNEAGTHVSLGLVEEEDAVVIQVADNGTGIPEELRRTLFQTFNRGDASNRTDGGTGLGLAIAHRAVELHGGTLRLLDTPGRTVFELVLPK